MPRSRSIAGSATLTTVASRKTTVEARIVAIRVSRSLRVTPTSVSGGAPALEAHHDCGLQVSGVQIESAGYGLLVDRGCHAAITDVAIHAGDEPTTPHSSA